jgi:hypothetical protein
MANNICTDVRCTLPANHVGDCTSKTRITVEITLEYDAEETSAEDIRAEIEAAIEMSIDSDNLPAQLISVAKAAL